MCLLSLLTCHYTGWARLIFVSCPNDNVSFYFFSSCRLWAPWPPVMISPECWSAVICHPSSVHPDLPCDLVGFPFVILERYNARSYIMSHALGRACLSFVEVAGLQGRSVRKMTVDALKSQIKIQNKPNESEM